MENTKQEARGCTSCEWEGTTDRMCGSVGPLCPDCGDTTEALPAPAASAAPSIDTNEFRDLLWAYRADAISRIGMRSAALVTHINQHVAAADRAARKETRDYYEAKIADLFGAATAPVSEAVRKGFTKIGSAFVTIQEYIAGMPDSASRTAIDGWLEQGIKLVGDDALCAAPVSEAGQAQDVCAEMRALCSACGGTGDVTSIDGEWRGKCDCEASQPAAMDEAAERAHVDLRPEFGRDPQGRLTAEWAVGNSKICLGFDADGHMTWAVYAGNHSLESGRAALAAPQGNSEQADARYREGYADGWSEGRRDITATAPQAAELPALTECLGGCWYTDGEGATLKLFFPNEKRPQEILSQWGKLFAAKQAGKEA